MQHFPAQTARKRLAPPPPDNRASSALRGRDDRETPRGSVPNRSSARHPARQTWLPPRTMADRWDGNRWRCPRYRLCGCRRPVPSRPSPAAFSRRASRRRYSPTAPTRESISLFPWCQKLCASRTPCAVHHSNNAIRLVDILRRRLIRAPTCGVGLPNYAIPRRCLGRGIVHAERDAQNVRCVGLEHDGLAAAGQLQALWRNLRHDSATQKKESRRRCKDRCIRFHPKPHSLHEKFGIRWPTECIRSTFSPASHPATARPQPITMNAWTPQPRPGNQRPSFSPSCRSPR